MLFRRTRESEEDKARRRLTKLFGADAAEMLLAERPAEQEIGKYVLYVEKMASTIHKQSLDRHRYLLAEGRKINQRSLEEEGLSDERKSELEELLKRQEGLGLRILLEKCAAESLSMKITAAQMQMSPRFDQAVRDFEVAAELIGESKAAHFDGSGNRAGIRKADVGDAIQIAYVHAKSWSETYTGLLPDSYIHERTPMMRFEQWTKALSKKDHQVYVAIVDSQLVGFASGDRAKERGFRSEISSLYVLKENQRQGIGLALWQRVTNALPTPTCVSVLQSSPAVGFYERVGCELTRVPEQAFGDAMLPVAVYRVPQS